MTDINETPMPEEFTRLWSSVKFVKHPKLEVRQSPVGVEITNFATGIQAIFADKAPLDLLDGFAAPQTMAQISGGCPDLSMGGLGQALIAFLELTFLLPELVMRDTPCPCCSESEFKQKSSIPDPRFLTDFNFVECALCGATYLHPMPDTDVMHFYYLCLGHYRTRRTHAQKGYLSGVKEIGEQRKLGVIKDVFPSLNGIKLLDVGCGDGSFLAQMAFHGAFAVGNEVDTFELERIKSGSPNIDVIPGQFVQANFSQTCELDLITFWSYFEHEEQQITALRRSRQLLKTGGVLIIELPDIGGRLAKIAASEWPFYDPPFHIIHHNKESLTKLLSKEGFQVIRWYPYGSSPSILKYSPLLLLLMCKLKLAYDSERIDRLVMLVSSLSRPIEDRMGLSGKMIIVAKKAETR
ncbi:MAG TPA: hypothetical protein DDY22_11530 [Geobacter sp.]|nr:hypothetical protein [Geobacter sp.]